MYVLICMHDSAAELYGPVIQERSLTTAMRAFGDSLRGSKDTVVRLHPEDHSLMHVANYDETTGVIVPLPKPQLIVTAAAMIRQIEAGEKPVGVEELRDEDRSQVGVHVIS